MEVKLDMLKAYDRVEWPFIEAMIRALGFCEKWVQLVLSCISTISYSILIKQPKKSFIPYRGLRQGDILSPYIFFICVKSLSSLINLVESRGEIKGLSMIRGGTSINHLLFVDDSILFCRATKFEWCRDKNIHNIYEKGLD